MQKTGERHQFFSRKKTVPALLNLLLPMCAAVVLLGRYSAWHGKLGCSAGEFALLPTLRTSCFQGGAFTPKMGAAMRMAIGTCAEIP